MARMGADDPSSLGLAEKKQKNGQARLQSFCFCPALFVPRMLLCPPFISVFIWVIRGFLKLSPCLRATRLRQDKVAARSGNG
jgi:hypothetical protein